MQIVLEGALPEPGIARELIKHLPGAAPTLAGWLDQGRALMHPVDATVDLCTPAERVLLQAHGFSPDPAQNLSAGLGPLLVPQASPSGSDAIWLAELVHIAPSREGAMLFPATEQVVDEAESRALLQAFSPYLDEDGFQFDYLAPYRWSVRVPAGFQYRAPSPALASQGNLNDWWSQDPGARSWRKLVNEFQMLAFDLPVNLERQARGLPPINSLWLYGGARRDQLRATSDVRMQVFTDLQQSHGQQDWGLWLQELGRLDAGKLAPLGPEPPELLVLTGGERYAEVRPAPRRIWPLSLIKHTENWSHWWSPQS